IVSEELEERVDDRSYFGAVLDDVASRVAVDERRVFVTGISRGGQASYFMACSFPDRIRAIAAVAMPLPLYMKDDCETGKPVGVTIMNGTEDPLVPYDGGTIEIGESSRDEVLSTSDSIALWADRNGCDLDEKTTSEIDPADDEIRVEKTEWRSCSGAPIVLYSLVGGGHTWPSGLQYLPEFIVGKVGRDIDGSVEAWRFFSEFE
ncbi:MAG: PHB depolymerase family esterase, partial [Myxococcota bacterium]